MAASKIEKEHVQTTEEGDVYCYTLKAGEVTVRILNYGCVIRDILVPDRHGKVSDICLGYRHITDYVNNPGFLGCITGRVSNRIDGAKFSLDDVEYSVSKNDPLGDNMCHGGFKGLCRRCFEGTIDGNRLVLTYVDADMTEGFPGALTVTVTYELTLENGLMIDYQATTTKPTPVDLSNHFLANLGGHAAGSIRDHAVTLNADRNIEFNDRFIPTGKLNDVDGTPFDLRKPAMLGDILRSMPAGDGLHAANVLVGNKDDKKFVVRVDHPSTGRYMEVYTTEPVVVCYGGYYLDVLLKDLVCKDDTVYQREGGLLFMPQGYPNAVNQTNFPSCILRPGEKYHTTTWYTFGAK